MKNWKLINPGTTIKNKETFQDAIEFLALPKNDVVFINHKNRRRKTASFLLEIENTLECIFSALSQAILVLILNFDWYPGNTKTGDNCSSTWQLQIPRKKSHFNALNPPPPPKITSRCHSNHHFKDMISYVFERRLREIFSHISC